MSPTYSVCADHGYLIGEQHKCPLCGKATEVYSRITGYYRPVQNWNDGKSQEYKDRRVYDIEHSVLPLRNTEETAAPAETCTCEATPAPVTGKVILISRVTCPNCRVAESLLTKAGVAYEKRIAEENLDMCREYGVKV